MTSASWLKDTVRPTATLAQAPTATNSVTALEVTVAGADVTHYKYKLRETASASCSVATGYSAEVSVGAKITDSLAAIPDGALEICVIGRDLHGNWQTEATATSAAWTKDTTAAIATISGNPTGTNNSTLLNVTIGAGDVTHYKFKLRASGDATCSSSSGYSTEALVAVPISSDISASADGAFELCVVGRDAFGNWQTEAAATSASWTKDTLPPSEPFGTPSGSSSSTALNVAVA